MWQKHCEIPIQINVVADFIWLFLFWIAHFYFTFVMLCCPFVLFICQVAQIPAEIHWTKWIVAFGEQVIEMFVVCGHEKPILLSRKGKESSVACHYKNRMLWKKRFKALQPQTELWNCCCSWKGMVQLCDVKHFQTWEQTGKYIRVRMSRATWKFENKNILL